MAWPRTAQPGGTFAQAEVPSADVRALGTATFRWSHPEAGIEMAAFGEAERREAPPRELLASIDRAAGPGPWFGSFAFDPSRALSPVWEDFSLARFSLPALLWWRDGERSFLAANGPDAARRLDEARRRLGSIPTVRPGPGPARVLRRPGERARWDRLVGAALDRIRSGHLRKVVVARAIDVVTEADPEALLAALEGRYPSCRTFLLRADGGSAFVGATPEMLVRIEGREVFADALAGSADPAEAGQLPGRAKELREHRWVVEHVAEVLSHSCSSVHVGPEPVLRTLPNVVHLLTPVSGDLLPGRGVADVVAQLHPTPAVGGVPRQAALRFLLEEEGLDRGLYAGVVGIVGPGRADLAVALRCALVRPGRARLFVGAGIVEGSSADAEWAETELKALPLLEALGAVP